MSIRGIPAHRSLTFGDWRHNGTPSKASKADWIQRHPQRLEVSNVVQLVVPTGDRRESTTHPGFVTKDVKNSSNMPNEQHAKIPPTLNQKAPNEIHILNASTA